MGAEGQAIKKAKIMANHNPLTNAPWLLVFMFLKSLQTIWGHQKAEKTLKDISIQVKAGQTWTVLIKGKGTLD